MMQKYIEIEPNCGTFNTRLENLDIFFNFVGN